jgi:hypothetical protein
MTSARTPRGVALFAALALMSVIALLVAGAAASTRSSQRASRLAHTDALLTTAVDYALATTLGDASGLALADLPLGTPRLFDTPIPSAADVHVVVAVTRLPAGVLWMVADAFAGADRGHRRANLVTAFPWLGERVGAAVVSRGNVDIGPDVTFLADSSTDPECAALAQRPISVAPSALVSGIDSTAISVSMSALDSATYYLTARQLDRLREGGRVVHVVGDTTIAAGSFDGILIVDGALTFAGPFSATGLIVARGSIDATAGSFSLVGALMSFAPATSGAAAIKFSGVTIRYSQCAVDRALRRGSIPRRVVQRSWVELFSP